MMCVIIPTLQSEAKLTRLLTSLGSQADITVISDGGSTDQTLHIALSHGAKLACGRAGRGPQLQRGAKRAEQALADEGWMLFLHADCVLQTDWRAYCEDHIQNYPDKAGYFDLRFASVHKVARFLEGLVRIRCRLFGLPYGDQGLLISRRLYQDIGGYQALPLFEDVAIIRTLGRGRLRSLGQVILTCSEKYERQGFMRRGWRNFRLLRRYLRGENPDILAKEYL